MRRVGGQWMVGEPMTDAEHRTVALPAVITAPPTPLVYRRSGRTSCATPAASTSATTKELMCRFGRSSPTAALLYQHAADGATRMLTTSAASRPSRLTTSDLETADQPPRATVIRPTTPTA